MARDHAGDAKTLRDAATILLFRARRQTLMLTAIVRFLELAANRADRDARSQEDRRAERR